MHALLGYLLLLAVLMPAFSVELFCFLLGRTTRQVEVMELFRSTLQTFATVTSPYKIALSIIVLLCAFAVDLNRQSGA